MDIEKILAQVDTFFEEDKGKEAEQLLQQSVAQAEREQEDGVKLQLLNELIGYYRETSQREMVYQTAAQAIAQVEQMGVNGTIPHATTLLNAATAYRACGRLQESMAYYEQVQAIYHRLLPPGDMLMAGLKNNISLLYQELGDYGAAKEKLLEALVIAEKNHAVYETAVTYANLAGTCMQLGENEAAYQYAMKSVELFRSRNAEDSHFAAALATLGMYFYREKEYEKAVQYYRQAMETVERCLGKNDYYRRLQGNLAACEEACAAVAAGNGEQPEIGEQQVGVRGEKRKKEFARQEIVGTESVQAENRNVTAETTLKSSTVEAEIPDRKDGIGLALSREYFEVYGKPMLQEQFPAYMGRIAAGLAGRGSDCFGYDDEASRDHDWGPDFCLWVTDETCEEIGEALQQAYEQLPKHFKGYERATHVNGRNRRGVIRISEFYRELTGACRYEEIDWKNTADASLAAAVNGEVFQDEEGIFTAFREKLKQGYPEEIRYLKLAESAARFAQSAQYNYSRMLGRGDSLTAEMMVWDGMKEAMRLQHYIEGKYPLHDKWLLRSLQESEAGRDVAGLLQRIADSLKEFGRAGKDGVRVGSRQDRTAPGQMENDGGTVGGVVSGAAAGSMIPGEGAEDNAASGATADNGKGDRNVMKTQALQECGESTANYIEQLGAYFALEMYGEGVISDTESYLDAHSEELVFKASLAAKSNDELVEEIARLEFEAFDKVKNEGGRASCQNDWSTFSIMRKSQYLTWNRTMLLQYLYDFYREYHRGHNLIEEKYGRMMESTAPEKYAEIKSHFPALTPEKKAIIEQIVGLQVKWMEEFSARYPELAGNARNIHTYEDTAEDTSYETYLRGELGTYSDKMLELYGRYVVEYARTGRNTAYEIMENSVKMYGYKDVETAEREIREYAEQNS